MKLAQQSTWNKTGCSTQPADCPKHRPPWLPIELHLAPLSLNCMELAAIKACTWATAEKPRDLPSWSLLLSFYSWVTENSIFCLSLIPLENSSLSLCQTITLHWCLWGRDTVAQLLSSVLISFLTLVWCHSQSCLLCYKIFDLFVAWAA